MKQKVIRGLIVALVVILILAAIGFYFYEILVLKVPYTKNLVRTAVIVISAIMTLVKLLTGTGRKSLSVYEKAYTQELGSAFKEMPALRKKLLCACRLYNESNYKKALKYLTALLREAELRADKIPVLLFIALCYDDAGVPAEAIRAYCELLRLDPGNAQVHSNLGRLYEHVGESQAALAQYDRAIALEPDNYYPYANRANLYFNMQELDAAVADAKKALQIKHNGREAASLLAIIYALQGDGENQRKYSHIAIAAGQNAQKLKSAIAYYKSAMAEDGV